MNNRLIASLIALFALGAANPALAVSPEKFDFGPIQLLGFFVGDCGEFDVLVDSDFEGHLITYFDQDGNVVRIRQHFQFPNAVYYNSEHPQITLAGGPGELQNGEIDVIDNTLAVAGVIFKVTVPGHGVIFHEVGRTIFDFEPPFEVLFQAGPSQQTDGDVAALCAALTP